MEPIRISAKTLEDAITKACVELGVTSEMIDYDIVEHGTNGVFGFGAKPFVINVTLKQVELSRKDKAFEFLDSVFRAMNMKVNIDIDDSSEEELSINLTGDDMGVLIGKRGQTLDALQYLTGQVINKHCNDYLRVKIDTEDYRKRRQETLETLAVNIAGKVRRTRRPVALEPMNPYERRLIHSVLQNEKEISTRSEGEEPYRHVVIYCTRKRK